MTSGDDAVALHQEAVDAGNDHDFARQLDLVARARQLTDDPDVVDRLDITNAFGEAELGHHDRAVELCRRVLERPDAKRSTVGRAHMQLGMILARAGNAIESNRELSEALAIFMVNGYEPGDLANVHLNRGYNLLKLGDAVGAAADFAESASLFEDDGIAIGRAKSIFNLGYADLLAGNLVSALQRIDEAAGVLGAQSAMNRAIIQQDRAEVLVASGQPREAARALEAAAAVLGAEGLRRLQADCEVVLARTILADDPGRSRKVAAAAANRYRATGTKHLAAQARAAALVAQIHGGSRAKSLLDNADELARRLRESGLRQDADRLQLYGARLAVRRGEFADAAARLRGVRAGPSARITQRLLAFEVRAELAAARGQGSRTRTHVRNGLNELHSWQATFGSIDLQTSLVGHGKHLAQLGLRAAMQTGRPAVLLEWSERARSLASKVTSVRPPADAGLAADLAELRIVDHNDRDRVRALQEKIRQHSWFATQGTVDQPVDLMTLRDRLATDRAAMVAHIVLDDTLTALVVTDRTAKIVPLGRLGRAQALLARIGADLDFAAQQRSGVVASAVRASLRQDLAALDQIFVRPLLPIVGDRRLVLTPSASLSTTPWTCLPGLAGRPVTVPTSATRWIEQAAGPLKSPTVVGFVAGPRVRRASEEVAAASRAWQVSRVLVGSSATGEQVAELAANADLLHVASHGVHAGDNPLFSAIELVDGPWFGHDVDLLPRAPATVVLSACNLGHTSVVHGEEALGMTASWLHAGSRAVVSSPALLADDLACDVFGKWHRLVASKMQPAEALATISESTDEVVPLTCFGAGW